MKLKDKVAIVTGGSQGIGEAIALRYALEGAKVAVVYHKDDEAATRTVGKITSAGGAACAIKADCCVFRRSRPPVPIEAGRGFR